MQYLWAISATLSDSSLLCDIALFCFLYTSRPFFSVFTTHNVPYPCLAPSKLKLAAMFPSRDLPSQASCIATAHPTRKIYHTRKHYYK